ncbi:MAG: RNA-splicing factor, partial [Watsoniomyces obsoletus]
MPVLGATPLWPVTSSKDEEEDEEEEASSRVRIRAGLGSDGARRIGPRTPALGLPTLAPPSSFSAAV